MPYQYALSLYALPTDPFKSPRSHTFLIHPLSTHPLTRTVNIFHYHPPINITRVIVAERIFINNESSTHPINTPYQPALSTHLIHPHHDILSPFRSRIPINITRVIVAERIFINNESSVFLHVQGVGWLMENKGSQALTLSPSPSRSLSLPRSNLFDNCKNYPTTDFLSYD